jgi:hypothetical protein
LAFSVLGIDYLPSKSEFTFVRDPYVEKISPQCGPEMGGTRVRIFGRHLGPSTGVYCEFGSKKFQVEANFEGESLLTCISPPQTPGTVVLRLGYNGQQSTDIGKFTYHFMQSLYKSIPAVAGKQGGTMVKLFGSNFKNVSTLSCRFG